MWGKYKKRVQNTIRYENAENDKFNLDLFRNKLFLHLIIYVLPFGAIAIVAGIIVSWRLQQYEIFIFDLFALLTLILISFFKGLSIITRKNIFLGLIYLASILLSTSLGLSGPGLLYMLAFTVTACLVSSVRTAYITLLMNTIFILLIGINLEYNLVNIPNLNAYTTETWFGVSVNLIFVGIVVIQCFKILIRYLENSSSIQKEMNEELKTQHEIINQSVTELENKNQELYKFSHIVAHDLKEPLKSIQAINELIKIKYSQAIGPQGENWLEMIQSSADRMTDLMNALLAYSEIGAKRVLNDLNLNELMRDLKSDLSHLIKSNKAEINYSNLPNILAYQVEFRQLMQNLLANAIKFKKDGVKPIINISALQMKEKIQFTVSDNGIGIPEKQLHNIFNMFHRLHKKFEGNGVGLANCKKIVEIHQGDIWVESKEGEGSKFHFTIPNNPKKVYREQYNDFNEKSLAV